MKLKVNKKLVGVTLVGGIALYSLINNSSAKNEIIETTQETTIENDNYTLLMCDFMYKDINKEDKDAFININSNIYDYTLENIIDIKPINTIVKIVGEYKNYYIVNYNDTYGYINKDNISIINMNLLEEINLSNIDYNLNAYVCATTNVNIRQEASVESLILGGLKQGELLKEINHINGWYKVIYNSNICYIKDDYAILKYQLEGNIDNLGYSNKTSDLVNEKLEVIDNINQYEFVEIYDEVDDYYYVNCNNNVGFIRKEDVNNLSNTCAIVDISEQSLKFYFNKEKELETSVVTGKDTSPTQTGIYSIYYKAKDQVLRGDNYASPVNYWMPFNGGQGLHDADNWRYGVYGGEIYHTNGSHGCVNMPLDAASKVYEKINSGDNVLVKN